MKALKGLVIFMGLLLVAGLGLLGWGLYSQAGKMAAKGNKRPAVAASDFGAVEVPLPAGMRIDQVFVVGERVVLRASQGGPERFVVLDPASGAVSGSFVVVPEAPAAK